MDSLTQATLGASIAHLYWHKPLGRKSLLWGAFFGTLPDLDILAYKFLDDVDRLYWHRGESHSIFFIMLGSLFFGYMLKQYKWKEKIPLKTVLLGIFAIFSTHILIDYFTIYGTQLLAPISRYGFAHGNLFIIDPLYTLPLLFGIITAIFIKEEKRLKANLLGLYLSSFYALFSLGSHAYAHHVFTKALETQNIHVEKSITMATPFNTLLWRHLVKTSDGLKVGYYSLLAPTPIVFEDIKQNKELILPYKDQPNVQAIKWFSKGFWVAEKSPNGVRMNDLRFGEMRKKIDATPQTWSYIFSWRITKEGRKMQRAPRVERNIQQALHVLYKRMVGYTP